MKKLIKEVLDTFDFDKVHEVMIFLNWTWRFDKVPDVLELRHTAERLLKEAGLKCLKHYNTNPNIPYIIMSGGLRVEAFPNKKKTKIKQLSLEFVLATSFDYR